jgi:hypothetical protein
MQLTTTASVIDKLGGVSALAERTELTPDAVYVWRKKNRFPAHTFPLIHELLAAEGCTAPDSLWNVTK